MSPRTRMWSTRGMAPSTASRASRLLWTSERRPSVGPEAGSAVDAFVSVEEEDAQRCGDGNRDEETEDASQVATHHEREDDQHRTQVDGIAKHFGGDEVIGDVRDHEVEDQHHDDFAR